LQPNDSRRRNLTFVILRGERPLYLQQRPFNSDVPLKVPSRSAPQPDEAEVSEVPQPPGE
jgi:hypothetical protein